MINTLDEFKVYQCAMVLAEEVWKIVCGWSYFEKDTMGKQLVRAVDSIAANLSEGLGRFHFGESKHFGYYSRGSLYETRTWISKSYNRNLITEDQFKELNEKLDNISRMLNSYIKSIGTPTNKTPNN
jgi:four helix bundle protein